MLAVDTTIIVRYLTRDEADHERAGPWRGCIRIDQLTERDTLGFGDFSRRDEKPRFQLQCEINLSDCSLSNRLSASGGDNTTMPNCAVASAKSRRLNTPLHVEKIVARLTTTPPGLILWNGSSRG
jgi:hypothetical protein